jgi:Leucine-rich repeat (LRR) protein
MVVFNWSIDYLHIEGHQYNGAIPSEIGNLFLLTTLAFQHCSLTGTIPSEMGKLTALQELGLTGNFLSGTIPSELGVLGESLGKNDTYLRILSQVTNIEDL